MNWMKGESRLDRVLLVLYYFALVATLIAMYGRGDFFTPPFIYQGFWVKPIERIDHWAAVAPTATAHISGDRKLTFGEIGAHANALAADLLERCGEDRAPVAVLGHREPEMLIAFVGVVKSGRPYIPIDTALPQERINHILAIAKPTLVLTPHEIAKLSELGKSAPLRRLQPDHTFYIIFTSGSSGTPKGITITLSCLEHFIGWMLREQKFIESGEIFLNQAPFSFDLSVLDLYCSLVTGGTLLSISRDLVANPKLLYRALANSNITTWVSTPSFVKMCLVESTFDSVMLPRLRRFLFCGEILPHQVVSQLFERFPTATVWNT